MNNGAYTPDADLERIDEAASEWVVLLDEREITASEQDEFDRWIAADPRHRAAFDEMSRTWATIPVLNGLAHLAGVAPAPAPAPAPVEKGWNRGRTRRYAIGALGAMAASFLAFVVAPRFLSGPEVYETGIAQTQLVTLDDGSQVMLGPRSKLTVSFGDANRRVTLAGGEAFFEVAHNKERPFFVEAGRSVTRVVGTKFDVNYAANSVRVAVLEGLVQVSRKGTDPVEPAAVTMLKAGQRVEIDLAADASATPITQLAAPAPGAWREGRLIYDNSRLSDLIADVNRYYAPGVTVADKAILDLRVTASFKASEIPAFLGSVGAVLPVKATETGGGSYRLEAAAD